MELNVQGLCGEQYTVEVGVDDTVKDMRRKVAAAAGLRRDSFHMGFGGKEDGEDITQLSAGDIVTLTETNKHRALTALRALGEVHITAERLRSVNDAEVARLLLEAEVATVIPQYFCTGISITELDLSAVPAVSRIESFFLAKCLFLETIDLSGLVNVTHVHDYFLWGCVGLKTVDLAGLVSVTHVGDNFLLGCTGLTTVHLSGLRSVTHVGASFLDGCAGLTGVDLSGLRSAVHVGCDFLANCERLTVARDTSRLSSAVANAVQQHHRQPKGTGCAIS